MKTYVKAQKIFKNKIENLQQNLKINADRYKTYLEPQIHLKTAGKRLNKHKQIEK